MSSTGKYRWHGTLCGALLLFAVTPPAVVERFYSGWIFPKFHHLLDWVFGRLPFPGLYVVLVIAALVLLKWLVILFSSAPFLDKAVRITGHMSKWLVWFFVLWGFNYGRVPLEEKLGLAIRPLTRTELQSEVRDISAELADLRRGMERDTVPIAETWFMYKHAVANKLDHSLRQWGYAPVKVKGRELKEDILLRFDIGGFYLPYTGEANIDAGVHYYNKPFYMLHEMCHGNGFYDEAACNFTAYAASVELPGAGFQYSAKLAYLRYLLSDLYEQDSVTAITLKQALPPVLQFDLELLKRHAAQHTFRTSPLGEFINDRYLKLMGVPEGTRSYNKMVQLVYAWRKAQRENIRKQSS